MTPPSVLNLNACLMYAIGKAARRRLTERLAAHNLRLWHLTVMAMVVDLGPQMKTLLAARLDMNSSDLVKIVNDLVKTGHVVCARDPANRRRILVRLTPEGRTYLDQLNADIASTDDDVPAPLLMDRIEFADVIVLNKLDLVDSASADRLRAALARLNPAARIVPAVRGRVPAGEVLGTARFDLERAQQAPGWVREINGDHVPETEEYGISSTVFRSATPFHPSPP